MAKYMGLGLVLVGCIAMGIAAGKDMERRVRDLRELIKLLQLLEGEPERQAEYLDIVRKRLEELEGLLEEL